MTNEIKILCPGRKCKKCVRIVARMKEVILHTGYDAEIEIIDTIDKMLKYNTWILPTLVINNKVVARGYTPTVKTVIKHLKSNLI